jgi:hypothetical protein
VVTKSIRESGKLVVTCFSGVVTMPEIEEYFYWIVENYGAHIQENYSQIIYSSELEKMDIQINDVHRISHLRATVGRSSSGLNLAIVVPDLKYYWMAKMYQTLSKSSHIKTRLFRDTDSAFEWLGYENLLAD